MPYVPYFKTQRYPPKRKDAKDANDEANDGTQIQYFSATICPIGISHGSVIAAGYTLRVLHTNICIMYLCVLVSVCACRHKCQGFVCMPPYM